MRWYHKIGLVGILTATPGWYAYKQATDFFYTRREAMIQIKNIDEMKEDRKKLFDAIVTLDEKVSKIQGMLEGYFAVKQMQKSRVYSKESFKKNITEGG